MTHACDHDTQINVAETMMTAGRPWSTRVSIRQNVHDRRRCDYLTKPPTSHWIFLRIFSRTRRNTIPGSIVPRRGARRITAISPRLRISRRDKRSDPVKAPGLHVDLPRDSMPFVRIPPCRRIPSSGLSTRRSTPRWLEPRLRIDGGFIVDSCRVIS